MILQSNPIVLYFFKHLLHTSIQCDITVGMKQAVTGQHGTHAAVAATLRSRDAGCLPRGNIYAPVCVPHAPVFSNDASLFIVCETCFPWFLLCRGKMITAGATVQARQNRYLHRSRQKLHCLFSGYTLFICTNVVCHRWQTAISTLAEPFP